MTSDHNCKHFVGAKRMQQEEDKTNRVKNRRSSVFSNKSSAMTTKFQKECTTYKTVIPEAGSDVDQLDWWRRHQEALPLLSFLVRVTFAVPVASSKSERVFSVAGNTVTAKRACLSPETVEECVVVKSNVSLLRELGLRK